MFSHTYLNGELYSTNINFVVAIVENLYYNVVIELFFMGYIMTEFFTLSELDAARDIAKMNGDKNEFLRLCALRPALVKKENELLAQSNSERLGYARGACVNSADNNISCHW